MGLVIIGHRSSKSTFGANNNIKKQPEKTTFYPPPTHMGLMLVEFVDEYTGEVEICPLYPPIYSGLVLDNRLVS